MVNIHAAKTQLSKLLKEVEAGKEVTIARDGKPVARLVPIEAAPGKRMFGQYRGQIWLADDFDKEMTPEELGMDGPIFPDED